MRRLLITAAAALTLLAGCGGDQLGPAGGSSGSGTGQARAPARAPGRDRDRHRYHDLFDGQRQRHELPDRHDRPVERQRLRRRHDQPHDHGRRPERCALHRGARHRLVQLHAASATASPSSHLQAPARQEPRRIRSTSSTGTIDATYTAKGCSGSDVITATAAVGSADPDGDGHGHRRGRQHRLHPVRVRHPGLDRPQGHRLERDLHRGIQGRRFDRRGAAGRHGELHPEHQLPADSACRPPPRSRPPMAPCKPW